MATALKHRGDSPPTGTVPINLMPDYAALRGAVSEIFERTQREIEALKVRVYWQTGHLIHTYLETHPDEFAARVLEQLSEDTHVETTLFYRMLKFREAYPKVATWQLSWSHYRELFGVSDEVKRARLTRLAIEEGWTVRQLRLEIQKRINPKGAQSPGKPSLLEEPPQLEPGQRRVKQLKLLSGKVRCVVDLGFDLYEPLEGKHSLRANDRVQYDTKQKRWIKTGTPKALYYYEAQVERVVDGDTLLVHILTSHHQIRREYLRLRGVNAEPLDSPQGSKAKRWLEEQCNVRGQSPYIRIRTHQIDKYARYIADVWVGNTYLNQGLLAAGLVKRV